MRGNFFDIGFAKIGLVGIFAGFSLFCFSQTISDGSDFADSNIVTTTSPFSGRFDDTRLLYRKELSGGIHIHTSGWGFNLRPGRFITPLKKRYFDFELLTMKHPKEYKLTPINDDAKKYVFGKKNALGILRASYGRLNTLSEKEYQKNVQISYVYFFGASLAMVKPVYLKIAYPNALQKESTTIEKYNESKHQQDQIFGRAPYARGIDEISLIPGLHLKLALNFEHALEDELLRAVEVGVTGDAFLKKIPIMAFVDNQQFYFTGYVSIQFGKKSLD